MIHSTEPIIQINVDEFPYSTFAEFKQVYFTHLPGTNVNQIPEPILADYYTKWYYWNMSKSKQKDMKFPLVFFPMDWFFVVYSTNETYCNDELELKKLAFDAVKNKPDVMKEYLISE
eukprot:NODE_499_length_7667_cov_0.356897.p4 type:complete len:117 gc:universal NODE_499_length_7667_cov_0.356897:1147-1497(+)